MPALIVSKFLRNLTIVAGMWPYSSENKILTRTYRIYSNILRVSSLLLITAMLIDLPSLAKREPGRLGDQVGLALLLSIGLYKHYQANNGGFHYLIFEAEKQNEAMKSATGEVGKIYENHAKHIKFIHRLITIFISSTCTIYSIHIYLQAIKYDPNMRDENNLTVATKRPLMYNTWLPYDSDDYYILTNIWYEYLFYVVVVIVYASDCIYLTLIVNSICNIKIVQYYFENYDILRGVADNGKNEELAYHKVVWCIKKHQKTIKDIALLDVFIRSIMMADFLTRSLQLASTAIIILTMPFSLLYCWAAIYFFYMSFLVFVYYWHGNELREESMAVSDAIYRSNWYEQDKATKKLLLIIMMRSQQCLSLHVGSLCDVSNEILVKIAKSFYSMVTIFQNVTS